MILKRFYLFAIASILSSIVLGQNNIGIGLSNPHPSAILDIYSNKQGVLIPRMSSVQRTTIASPLANGLLVFDIDTGCVMVYDSVVILWKNLCALSGGNTGLTGPTGVPGNAGPTGPTGANGTNGIDGATGPTGANGTNGAAGATGPTGANGTNGTPGATGANGTNGAAGATGPTGANGTNGAAGATGAQGNTGPTGPLGAAGGDLSGTYPDPTVVGLQTYPISNTPPVNNNILEFNGTDWTPTNPNGLFWQLIGNTGTTASSSPIGTTVNNNYIGTTDAKDFVIATDDLERMRVMSGGNVGIGTEAPLTTLHVVGPGLLATGTYTGTAGTIPTSGPGNRMMWYSGQAAFRAGNVSGAQWNDANVGTNSVGFGYNSTASGVSSTALGSNTIASGTNSTSMGTGTTASNGEATAMGDNTLASGPQSLATGYGSIASGSQSVTTGTNTTASGAQSIAMGYGTVASNAQSTATGTNTTASGAQSIAMGYGTVASNVQTTAMGDVTTASGVQSTSMGYGTLASGAQSTAMGDNTTASGPQSTSLGYGTTASGAQSTAMGDNTIASSAQSTAIGYGSVASGTQSTAMGIFATALSYSETAIGTFNTPYTPSSTTAWVPTDRLFGIGNGVTGATNDAMVILKNGNVGIGTSSPGYKLSINNGSTNGAIQIQDGTQSLGYVLTSDANGVGTWQKPAVHAAYSILGAGVSILYTTATYLYTGTTLTLPPGEYSVNVNMLMTSGSNSTASTSFWVRSTFGDLATSTTPSADIVGSPLASGGLVGPARYSMLTGTIIINNTSGGNKTYYYIAGNVAINGSTATLTGFGGNAWSEDNIVAIEIQ